ncbi:hypothetical protein SAZ_13145 [Streptomyces noursei ZPM]|nr:hypothetical protein SAZ_13145 [Streptomyces noursei ZPM]EPY93170.1 hypothetical protein K530_49415 [Streptomyces noursei CCRC 11814]
MTVGLGATGARAVAAGTAAASPDRGPAPSGRGAVAP